MVFAFFATGLFALHKQSLLHLQLQFSQEQLMSHLQFSLPQLHLQDISVFFPKSLFNNFFILTRFIVNIKQNLICYLIQKIVYGIFT